MDILVAAPNVWRGIGGGESYFQARMRRSSNRFVCFVESEERTVVPGNVELVPLGRGFRDLRQSIDASGLRVGPHGPDLSDFLDDLLLLFDMAFAVRGRRFDACETPDYWPHAAFFPAALRQFNVTCDRAVLAMHGSLADALSENWSAVGLDRAIASLRLTEDLAYRAADVRYGIGKRYLARWEARTGIPAVVASAREICGPVDFQSALKSEWRESGVPPQLWCVARQDKLKGPDLFLEIASQLPAGAISGIGFVGAEVSLPGGRSADELGRIARLRGFVPANGPLPRSRVLAALAKERLIVVCPSRLDTFNLVALEAIYSGCPVVVSTACGVLDYIDEYLPGAPVVRLDPHDIPAAMPQLHDMCERYDHFRLHARAFAARVELRSDGATHDSIAALESQHDAASRGLVQRTIDALFKRVMEVSASHASSCYRASLASMAEGVPHLDGRLLGTRVVETLDNAVAMTERLHGFVCRSRELQASHAATELTVRAVRGGVFRGARVAFYAELAAVESVRENAVLRATYLVRAMRLSGKWDKGRVLEVASLLEATGYPHEAVALRLIAGNDATAVRRYLDERLERFRELPDCSGLECFDRRGDRAARVSVIVSIYNGADKLAGFLSDIDRSTADDKALLEVILVDSGSTDATGDHAKRLLEARRPADVPVLYVRTAARETIQRAWNRGIALARGEFLSFLGLDERNRPGAFAQLVKALDSAPACNWAQGHRVVSQVSRAGSYEADVLAYRQPFGSQYKHLLDCTAFGYVGALYRRSLHDRVGYYDDSFRGAGDTEFKNRALPHIRIARVDEVLGRFLDFPEARMTSSPLAELEDLRAWYLFRTPGGVAYEFDGKPLDDARDLLGAATRGTKAYMETPSTDAELACAVSQYLETVAERGEGETTSGLATWWTTYRDALRAFDAGLTSAGAVPLLKAVAGYEYGVRVIRSIELAMKDSARPRFGVWDVCGDNRSHQHISVWPSPEVARDLPSVRSLAGAQDLAEVLSACCSTNPEVDFESAWRTGRLEQVRALFEEKTLDVLIVPGDRRGAQWRQLDDWLFVVLQALRAAAGARSAVVAAPRSRLPMAAALQRVYFVDDVETYAPVVAAVRQVWLCDGEARLHKAEASIGPWARDLGKLCFEGVQAPWALATGDGAPAKSGRTTMAEAEEVARAMSTRGARSADHGPGDVCVWGEHISTVNQVVRVMLEHGHDEARRRLHEARSTRKSRGVVDVVIDALLVTKDAPILRTAQPFFSDLSAREPFSSVDTALEHLFSRR